MKKVLMVLGVLVTIAVLARAAGGATAAATGLEAEQGGAGDEWKYVLALIVVLLLVRLGWFLYRRHRKAAKASAGQHEAAR